MSNEEFSNQFDTLLNSYNIQAGFGEGANKQGGIALDEYEKSVLLTQAQDIIVKSYFDRTLNSQGQGFDDTARRQVDFSSLIKVKKYSSTKKLEGSDNYELQKGDDTYDDRGYTATLDKKILFVLNEKLEVNNGSSTKVYVVVPINYREYDREMSKAYAQPLKKQAWRLFSNASTGYDIKSEIIPIYGSIGNHDVITSHYVQYEPANEDDKWLTIGLTGSETVKGTVESTDDLPADAEAGDIYRVIDSKTSEADSLSYVVRYVERPTPIVLTKLPNDLTVDDEEGPKECSLNPILHMDILNKAFELAITTRGGGTAQQRQDNNNRQ